MRLLAVLPDGTLTLGYGDYGTNTGPIDLLGLDPETGDWSVLYAAMPTEEINSGSVIDGYLWVPSTDPAGTSVGTVLTNSPAGTWRLVTCDVAGQGPASHLHRTTGVGGAVYVCGSRYLLSGEGDTSKGAAIVWKTTTGGTSWTEDLVYVTDGPADDLRFYVFRDLGGLPCVVASDNTVHYTLAGGTWTEHAGTPTPPPPRPYPAYDYAEFNGTEYVCDGVHVYRI